MNVEIIKELTTIKDTKEAISKQVLQWAKRVEAQKVRQHCQRAQETKDNVMP